MHALLHIATALYVTKTTTTGRVYGPYSRITRVNWYKKIVVAARPSFEVSPDPYRSVILLLPNDVNKDLGLKAKAKDSIYQGQFFSPVFLHSFFTVNVFWMFLCRLTIYGINCILSVYE